MHLASVCLSSFIDEWGVQPVSITYRKKMATHRNITG